MTTTLRNLDTCIEALRAWPVEQLSDARSFYQSGWQFDQLGNAHEEQAARCCPSVVMALALGIMPEPQLPSNLALEILARQIGVSQEWLWAKVVFAYDQAVDKDGQRMVPSPERLDSARKVVLHNLTVLRVGMWNAPREQAPEEAS